MITAKLPLRLSDNYGSGLYGVSRDGGARTHNGVDYCCVPHTEILSPVSGKVTKVGYPYSNDLSFRYVEVTEPNGLAHRVFYLSPRVTTGQDVIKGRTVLGESQDLTKRYPNGMTNHVHYEVRRAGTYYNPENL